MDIDSHRRHFDSNSKLQIALEFSYREVSHSPRFDYDLSNVADDDRHNGRVRIWCIRGTFI